MPSPAPGTISRLIADYVLGLRLDDVSPEVQRFAKIMLLDCLGCMIVGAATPSGPLRKLFRIEWRKVVRVPVAFENRYDPPTHSFHAFERAYQSRRVAVI